MFVYEHYYLHKYNLVIRMATNKIFETGMTLHNATNYGASMVSKVRVNREYLISKEIAGELNTYVSFDPFPTLNDLFAPNYDKKGKDITEEDKSKGSGTLGVRSLFNKAGAVVIGSANTTTSNIIAKKASNYRISNNVPLMDNRETRAAINAESGCTIKDLVRASQQGLLGRSTYSYSDFMFCKYLGRISNNYMVTLRRFPYPVDDFISSIGCGFQREEFASNNSESLGCLVTWMGTPGNNMENILKYTVTMPFKEQTARMQNNPVDADGQGGGLFNQIAAAFDPVYRQQYMDGQAGDQVNKLFNTFLPVGKDSLGEPPYRAKDWNSWKDDSKVYGPIDVIKKIYMRGEDGLDFQQNLTLTFDYELRAYNGINGRQAMLDLLSNVLNVTYSTGTFWGGGFRGGGAHQNNIFTNLNIFKKNERGMAGFIDAFAKDYSTLSSKVGDAIEANGGLLNTLKQLANNLGGMLISGALNKLGRPQKQMAQSMLSPAPVGFWHVTIGNPHHPIMSIGNMILKSAEIQHYGPLGIDDFPTGLKVVCQLTRGKSRDIRDIEKLYMKGNDRIYTSMGPKVFDMYQHAKEYRESNGKVNGVQAKQDGNADTDVSNAEQAPDMKGNLNAVLKKYFGHSNTTSIRIAAMEQENGAAGKKKTGTAGGDSSASSHVVTNN